MPNNSLNVRAGSGKVGGYLLRAPLGTTKPTNLTGDLDPAFEVVGYVSEDGIQRAGTTETEDWKDLNGDIVRTVQTETGEQFEFTLMETRQESLEAVFGAENVTVTGGVAAVQFTGNSLDHAVWVIELEDGPYGNSRILIHDGQVVNPGGGDQTIRKAENMGWPVTVKGYRDGATGAFSTRWYALPNG